MTVFTLTDNKEKEENAELTLLIVTYVFGLVSRLRRTRRP